MVASASSSFEALIVSTATFLLILFMISHIFHAFYGKNNLDISTILYSLLSMFCGLFFSLTILILSLIDISGSFNKISCALWWTVDTYFSFAKLFMYLFFIARLHQIFDGSLFTYSRKHLKYFAIFIMITLITPIIMIMTWVILPLNAFTTKSSSYFNNISSTEDCSDILHQYETVLISNLVHWGIRIFVTFDLLISCGILRLYLKKLLLLSLAFDRINISAVMQTNSKTKKKKKKKQKENEKNIQKNMIFFQTAQKIFNLTLLALTTSWFAILIHGLQLGLWWLCIDCIFNSLSMYLSFSFTNKIYNNIFLKYLCFYQKENCCFNSFSKMCICCCLPKELPKHVALLLVQQYNKQPNHLTLTISRSVSTSDNLPIIPILTQKSNFNDFNQSNISSTTTTPTLSFENNVELDENVLNIEYETNQNVIELNTQSNGNNDITK